MSRWKKKGLAVGYIAYESVTCFITGDISIIGCVAYKKSILPGRSNYNEMGTMSSLKEVANVNCIVFYFL